MTNNYIKEINFIYWTTANDILINRSCFKKQNKMLIKFWKKESSFMIQKRPQQVEGGLSLQ